MYISIKKGVYLHDWLAISDTKNEAMEKAVGFIEKEKDDYHEVLVFEIEVGEIEHRKPVKIIRREGTEIIIENQK